MTNYQEQEIKVLEVDIPPLQLQLEKMGAIKVFDDERIFTTFDTRDLKYLSKNTIIRLTEEGKLKLSASALNENREKETVKVFTSRKAETVDFLAKLEVYPIAEVRSHRISYEWEGIDFDIDQFPDIPPFIEIDIGNLKTSVESLLFDLGLSKNPVVTMGTEEVYTRYGKSYFDLFAI